MKTGFLGKSLSVVLAIFVGLAFLAFPALADTQGKLIIFNAGSLSIPLKQMSEAFNKKYPNVEIQREAAGSRVCARKITDLKKPCDIMASADYEVIDTLLIPKYASWDIHFATNQLAIMYRPDSKYAKEINSNNWYRVLLKKGVQYGHSDPNSDPCGYRTLLSWQLAEKYYKDPGLYQKLMAGCPPQNVRPKETDLIALLEAGQLDYIFIYKSVCEQHHMPYVALPCRIKSTWGPRSMPTFTNRPPSRFPARSPAPSLNKKVRP
jgi:molybdate/tungstate transport system substrate-binding protein